MSTYYRPSKKIHINEYKKIKDLKIYNNKNGTYMKAFGSYLHFDVNIKGEVIDFYRYGGNNESDIFGTIVSHPTFGDMSFISEYDEDYYQYQDEDTAVKSISLKDLKPISELVYDETTNGKIVRKKKLN